MDPVRGPRTAPSSIRVGSPESIPHGPGPRRRLDLTTSARASKGARAVWGPRPWTDPPPARRAGEHTSAQPLVSFPSGRGCGARMTGSGRGLGGGGGAVTLVGSCTRRRFGCGGDPTAHRAARTRLESGDSSRFWIFLV